MKFEPDLMKNKVRVASERQNDQGEKYALWDAV